MKTPPKVLTIAGSDCSGGAGIQADLKTFATNGVYGMSVVTALTAQNTLGVTAVHEVPPEFVAKQLDAVFNDIVPDAVKVGMVSGIEIISVIAEKLEEYKATNIVVDPVMVSTSGSSLLSEDAIDALVTELFPLATLITPNVSEAKKLWDFAVRFPKKLSSEMLSSLNILFKGGHNLNDANDILQLADGIEHCFEEQRINNPNTHGTGCTLSSAIACNLAKGETLVDSVRLAKDYVTSAIQKQLNLGKGDGPLWHGD
ncbi:MAG: bifunctional hydroxymethylpyrimidine kinase/phosphomethylpyrimidine kinase [Oscillospiraceae bacterium]|nr:bifunctional hydroxymethylpyrimidine kinase/phosphomethylpyrimidine kinase [Oscillospiraceae bacterium]